MNLRFLIHRVVIIGIISLVIISCDKSADQLESDKKTEAFLVFGQYAGFCAGEGCIEIFKIENGKLYEDINDLYPSAEDPPYPGNYQLLADEKYELVKELANQFPDQLRDEVDLVLGMADTYDQGGLYFEIKDGDKTHYWVLDRDKNNLPTYLHSWVDLVIEKIGLLQP